MVTLAEVAARAGVSISTASRALSGRGEMTTSTRRRVQAIARELGYARMHSAGGRPSGSGRLLDLVLTGYHTAYADEVTAGARSAAADAGYDLVLTEERDDPRDDWPVRIRRRGSSGVLLGLITPTANQLGVLAEAGIPVVVMDPVADSNRGLGSVRTTDREGAADAAEHLLARGATTFAMVNGVPAYRFGRARREGFVSALRRRHPSIDVPVIDASWASAEAHPQMIELLRSLAPGERIGVFAGSDAMAAGVYAAAAAASRRIPDDVLVVGFDDIRGARWLTPPLSTVHQPIRDMAGTAVRMLADAAAGEALPAEPVVLPTRLIVRGST